MCERGKPEPDACWGLLEHTIPGIVMEVAYTQKVKDLPKLANEYLVNFRHEQTAVKGVQVSGMPLRD